MIGVAIYVFENICRRHLLSLKRVQVCGVREIKKTNKESKKKKQSVSASEHYAPYRHNKYRMSECTHRRPCRLGILPTMISYVQTAQVVDHHS